MAVASSSDPALAQSLSELAQSLSEKKADSECSSSKYTDLIQDYVKKHRGGVPLHHSVVPTQALIGKVLKQIKDSDYDPIPLKFCHPKSAFELREMALADKTKRMKVTSNLALEFSKSADDFEKPVGASDLMSCIKVLGMAYAVCDVCDPIIWGVHVDAFAEKLSHFPEHSNKLRLIEYRLRARWVRYVRENATPLIDAIKHFQEESASQLFWTHSLAIDPDTRIVNSGSGIQSFNEPREQFRKSFPKGAGKEEFTRRKQTPRSEGGKGKRKGLDGSPAKKKLKRADSLRGRLQQYKGPLNFEPPQGKICFKGASKSGCPRGAACPFAASHGTCPLPACGGAKHVCEATHPGEWRAFAAAVFE